MEKIDILRHSAAHVLAAAVLEMFPKAKFAIGPSIEDGFYYDFDLPRSLTQEDLPELEKKMKAIIKKNFVFERKEMPVKEAIEFFKEMEQPYKVELIEDLVKNGKVETVSVYTSGNFVDLCRGPHLESTGKIDSEAVKLTKIAGAYWRGDEKNKMLQRIYGTAWETKADLENYIKRLEEAEKRDHRKIGKTRTCSLSTMLLPVCLFSIQKELLFIMSSRIFGLKPRKILIMTLFFAHQCLMSQYGNNPAIGIIIKRICILLRLAKMKKNLLCGRWTVRALFWSTIIRRNLTAICLCAMRKWG